VYFVLQEVVGVFHDESSELVVRLEADILIM
jgi:hypothetical protein